LTSLIVKELENKSIVWFENSNQYLVLEQLTAAIVNDLFEKKEVKKIATHLESELDIPLEKAIDFILDIEEKIVKPNLEFNQKKARNPKNYSSPNSYLYTKTYLINAKTFKVQFSNEFELSLIHPKFAHLETLGVSRPSHVMKIFNNANHIYFTLDDELVGSWSRKDVHYFQGKFSMKIIECTYKKLEDKWMGVFHASAIGKKNNSILVLGDSGNGKSTSLALLQAHGLNCIADDFVPIDNQQKVHAFPAGISIKKNSLETLLPFYPELETSAEYHYERLNKVVRYLPPKDIDYEKLHPCKALVFIKYNKEVELEFEQVSNINAFEKLIPDSWISQKQENVSVFLDWFSSLPCYELTYSNNRKMIDTMRKLLDNEL